MLIIKSVIHSIAELDRRLSLLSDIEFFSSYERHYCLSKSKPLPSFSGIWCAKEAFSQAIANLDQSPRCPFLDIEVCHDSNGRPYIGLKNYLTQWCHDKRMAINLSISHSREFAAASVLLYSVQNDGTV
ncbi:holo-ACP synthase [Phormidesmis priestleyi]|uniref:holo-ACP synthase n=1 Tax=Phormidesmis priestleyi TaxID=268141 RepID=UPI0015E6C1F7|nr:4'-phosphopantetheinyl transferase superfamily protein [Phormidesmis priestleyi]